MTTGTCPRLMVFLSPIIAHGLLIPGHDPACDTNEFVPLLSDYKPALDYCSSTFPVPYSSVTTTSTTTITVPPQGITTVVETVDGGTVTEEGKTVTIFVTSTVTNTDPTTLVATATSGSQKLDARPGQLNRHENREIRRGDEFLIYDLHHRKAGSSNNYKDSKPPVNPGSSYEFDEGELHYGDADGDDDESYDDGFDSSGYGESVDGTWYPVLSPERTHYDESPRPSDAASAAAFSRFQDLPNTSQSFICSCLGNQATTQPTSTGLLTLSKTVTVTSTDDSLPLVPTDTFRWTWTEVVGTTIDTTVTNTKTATALTGPIITCIADPASNILVNGGFDDSVADQWGDIDPKPWGWAGRGWGPTFLGSSPGGLNLNTQTPSNLLYFPGDDDGADFEVWQDSTNLDTSLNYTVSFWYRLPTLRAQPYDPDGQGPCPFSVTWGGNTIFTKDFDQGDVGDDWKHVNSPIDLSPQSPNARLDIKMYCSPAWLGVGALTFFIDSVAIYPSNELVCDGA